MREIKFRAWDNTNKRWVNNYEQVLPAFYPGARAQYGTNPPSGGVNHLSVYVQTDKYETDCDLMLFTGLKDCNGKEIYEGDLIEIFGCVREVVYALGAFGYHIDEYSGFVSFAGNPNLVWIDGKSVHEQIKVIGNIYENPELIE